MKTTAKTKTEFYTADGFLTSYGFACGYVEKAESSENWKHMYHEHGAYHVRTGKHKEQFNTWETFETLTPAKRFYKSIKL